jgi:UDP-GlcNAc3NAcA epimerase
MLRLATVLGARPQFIKASALSHAIAADSDVQETIIHTGQHYDSSMSGIFFEQLEIPHPAYNLGVSGGGHGAMTGRQLEGIEDILVAERPDCVVVYGDTNSTLAAALAAAKLHVPVAHIEAGLRSFNKRMPEEVNRILTDHVSAFLFAPSQASVAHLAREGIDHAGVHCAGDIMCDVARIFGPKAQDVSNTVEDLGLTAKGFVLATIHRQENTDDPARLLQLFEALRKQAEIMPVVLPLHPRTRKALAAEGKLDSATRGLIVLDPIPFFDITRLLTEAALVMTDSGGMQKEAFYHGTRSVILREETEWVELLELNRAVIPESLTPDAILKAAQDILELEGNDGTNPYGDGHAAQHILEALKAGLSAG